MKTTRLVLTLALAACCASSLSAAEKKYTGPRPEKADVPFLQHADKLIEVETGQAEETRVKDNTVFTVPGMTSKTRTPIPEPIFLFQSAKVNPEHFTLYKMEVKGGQRTLTMSDRQNKRKDGVRPLFILVNPIATSLFKIEVNEVLEPGEYCLSPEGANTVYCFTEF